MQNNKKILVCYASTGSGHNIASLAIFDELKKMNFDANIERVDILDYFSKSDAGDKFVNATSGALAHVFDYTWRHNFTGRILWGGGSLWPSFLYKKFEDYIIEQSPDLVICTHQVCSNVAAKARLKMNKYFPIVSVPTDYETEGLWPHKQTDLFCVASKDMAYTLLSRKVPKDNIFVSGLPVMKDFCKSISRAKAKQECGLPNDKKIALVIAGAKEPGPYQNIRKTLNGAIKYLAQLDWIHFVVCVGQDANYASKLIRMANKYNANNFTILNYTDKLHMFMSAADVAIIKPGGLATTECICKKLPMLLVGKTYAQENINRRYLLSCGVAEHTSTYKGLVNVLCDIFVEKKRYNKLLANIEKTRNLNAAQNIAKASVNLMNTRLGYEKEKFSLYIGKKPAHTQ